jgi:uncharacterized membrane protein YeaQ/YmgE (transglycosylase-associated protein family)
MAFELLTWVGFGAVLGLLSLWLSRFRHHWFETLVAGVGGAFTGGLLAPMALTEGLRIGHFEIVRLVSAMAGSRWPSESGWCASGLTRSATDAVRRRAVALGVRVVRFRPDAVRRRAVALGVQVVRYRHHRLTHGR